MSDFSVIRTDTEHMRIGDRWFMSRELYDLAFKKVVASGSDNPAFDMPPWFYTGSPYGEELLKLGATEVPPPSRFRIVFVPDCGEGWVSRPPAWPEIFGVLRREA